MIRISKKLRHGLVVGKRGGWYTTYNGKGPIVGVYRAGGNRVVMRLNGAIFEEPTEPAIVLQGPCSIQDAL